MLPDWKEPEKLADNVVVDAESNDETRFEAAITSGVPQDAEVPGLQPGTILAERFEILSLLGSGGMSKVFKAKDLLSDKTVVLKVIAPERLKDEKNIQRFRQEAKALSTLSHPNVVAVRDFGQDQSGTPYLVMDYVEVTPLSEVLRQQGALTANRAIEIAIQACKGLDHAHTRGLVHRDIKPSNILLVIDKQEKEHVQIVDFGIARALEQSRCAHVPLTETGEMIGTPWYMSPEQCFGQIVDARSDVYQVGCLLYELLTGKPPFDGATSFEVMYKHVTGFAGLEAVEPSIQAVLMKALDKNPDKRYQTIDEMGADLEGVSAGLTFEGAGLASPTMLTQQKNLSLTILALLMWGGAYSSVKHFLPEPTSIFICNLLIVSIFFVSMLFLFNLMMQFQNKKRLNREYPHITTAQFNNFASLTAVLVMILSLCVMVSVLLFAYIHPNQPLVHLGFGINNGFALLQKVSYRFLGSLILIIPMIVVIAWKAQRKQMIQSSTQRATIGKSPIQQQKNKLIKAAMWTALLLPILLILLASDLAHRAKNETIHGMKVQLVAEKRNDAVAWAGMAQELEQKGEFVYAERAYRKAIQLKPDYKPAWLGLGKILEKQGKSTDAAAAFMRADELKSDLEK